MYEQRQAHYAHILATTVSYIPSFHSDLVQGIHYVTWHYKCPEVNAIYALIQLALKVNFTPDGTYLPAELCRSKPIPLPEPKTPRRSYHLYIPFKLVDRLQIVRNTLCEKSIRKTIIALVNIALNYDFDDAYNYHFPTYLNLDSISSTYVYTIKDTIFLDFI